MGADATDTNVNEGVQVESEGAATPEFPAPHPGVWARATIHAGHLRPGLRLLVDPTSPWIAAALEAGYLVPDPEPETATEADSDET